MVVVRHGPRVVTLTAIGRHNRGHVQRPRWYFGGGLQEVTRGQLQDRIEATLEADCRARATTHAFAARAFEVGWEHLEIVFEL